MAHAELSPSSAQRWTTCPGSVALVRGLPDTSNTYADEGTLAHALAEHCLTKGVDAATVTEVDGKPISKEMAGYVQQYVDTVRDLSAGGELFVEQRLSISEFTGEEDAYGTSDAVAVVGNELIVIDLKYGMGEPVSADDNRQLQLYALAALREFELSYDIQTVRMVIHQPRIGGGAQ